ncbi:alpha-L-fucosidase [Dysgonomonas capnocytophagoides]|uniref:alpha-L-fucosidase n=1 Tax=Dysgonomonas capnocytophagoides TaxID=45254 RepID=UPI002924A655|nr:alpha-L-fucosidase [Dysgonomonas capnocytophagoides]
MKNSVLIILLTSLCCLSCKSKHEALQVGKYEPTWESLSQYSEAPEWFRDVKFGIWAHWGPQCQPEGGDWYARNMYDEGGGQYKYHLDKYGHPSEFGFKDVINEWKGDKWDPEKLLKLYKKAGAEYFFAMGNHHDNFDLWDSKYQRWNSVNLGPKRDILGEWEKAARANDMYFGVSIHSAHAWNWYETTQRADKKGEKSGVPYDGKLTKEDGKGKWWEGYDPQELYVQNHPLSEGSDDIKRIHQQWGWTDGVSIPSEEYCQNFLDRNIDMINKYNPDLIYYDDTALPLWPVSDVGLKAVSHYYNKSIKENNGKNEVVVFGKILNEDQKNAIVWDVEKGAPDKLQEKPWQTCTCLGGWHYDRGIYDRNRYKSASNVILQLIDVVSKNGNLLLSVPMRGDGTIDEKEEVILEGIARWMDINKEAIHGTRPWKVYGEGPTFDTANPIHVQGFNEGRYKFTSNDFRFLSKSGVLYVHVMGWPEDGQINIKSLSKESPLYPQEVKSVEMLGSNNDIQFNQAEEGLLVKLPANDRPNEISFVLKID